MNLSLVWFIIGTKTCYILKPMQGSLIPNIIYSRKEENSYGFYTFEASWNNLLNFYGVKTGKADCKLSVQEIKWGVIWDQFIEPKQTMLAHFLKLIKLNFKQSLNKLILGPFYTRLVLFMMSKKFQLLKFSSIDGCRSWLLGAKSTPNLK